MTYTSHVPLLPVALFTMMTWAGTVSRAQSLNPNPVPSATPVAKHTPPAAHGPHLEGKNVTLPLALVKGFPFVEGSINGKSGKLMFDAGESGALAVDSHTVGVPGGVRTGVGSFGSGQTFEVLNVPLLDDLRLANRLHYTGMTNIHSYAGIPIETDITPDFIRWIGAEFYSGYVMKLDYAKPAVMFYRDDALGSGEKAAVVGEAVVQTISFDNKGKRNLLHFPVKIGEMDGIAVLDTGSHTVIWLSQEQIDAMTRAGTLKDVTEESATLVGLRINGRTVEPLKVQLNLRTASTARFLPETAGPILTLAYEFLSQYKTVWDLDSGTLTLLRR